MQKQSQEFSFLLKPRPPFRLDLTVWTLRRRKENTVDRWDGRVYRRVLPINEAPALIEVKQLSESETPRLSVAVHFDGAGWMCDGSEWKENATGALKRLLGIRIDMGAFYGFAVDQRKLGPLMRRYRGMKPPRFLTGFECLANSIACQQISLAAGIQLLNRFAEAYGQSIQLDGETQHAFPRPEDLTNVDPDDLRQLGFSRQKARALLDLALLIGNGEFGLDQLQMKSDADAVTELCRLRGIGRWSAEYALLRGMGRVHVFPGDDVGARNNLARWLRMTGELDYDRVSRRLRRWKPFAGLIYFHLLLDKLAAAGHVRPNSSRPSKRGDTEH